MYMCAGSDGEDDGIHAGEYQGKVSGTGEGQWG